MEETEKRPQYMRNYSFFEFALPLFVPTCVYSHVLSIATLVKLEDHSSLQDRGGLIITTYQPSPSLNVQYYHLHLTTAKLNI
jgi:hypothetical protein